MCVLFFFGWGGGVFMWGGGSNLNEAKWAVRCGNPQEPWERSCHVVSQHSEQFAGAFPNSLPITPAKRSDWPTLHFDQPSSAGECKPLAFSPA